MTTEHTAPSAKSGKVHRVLSGLQKKQLCLLKEQSPKLTQSKLIEYATNHFGITPSMSQINRMLISKEQFLRMREEDGDRKRNRGAKWPRLEEAVDAWYTTMKAQGNTLSDNLILAKAKEKAEELGISPFSGSGGWLSNFKHRQGIRSHTMHQESDAANVLTSLAQSIIPGAEGGPAVTRIPAAQEAGPGGQGIAEAQTQAKRRGRPPKSKSLPATAIAQQPHSASAQFAGQVPAAELAQSCGLDPSRHIPDESAVQSEIAFRQNNASVLEGALIVAIGVPAPTVTGHVAEDQGLGFSVFREAAPGQPQESEPSTRQDSNAAQTKTEEEDFPKANADKAGQSESLERKPQSEPAAKQGGLPGKPAEPQIHAPTEEEGKTEEPPEAS